MENSIIFNYVKEVLYYIKDGYSGSTNLPKNIFIISIIFLLLGDILSYIYLKSLLSGKVKENLVQQKYFMNYVEYQSIKALENPITTIKYNYFVVILLNLLTLTCVIIAFIYSYKKKAIIHPNLKIILIILGIQSFISFFLIFMLYEFNILKRFTPQIQAIKNFNTVAKSYISSKPAFLNALVYTNGDPSTNQNVDLSQPTSLTEIIRKACSQIDSSYNEKEFSQAIFTLCLYNYLMTTISDESIKNQLLNNIFTPTQQLFSKWSLSDYMRPNNTIIFKSMRPRDIISIYYCNATNNNIGTVSFNSQNCSAQMTQNEVIENVDIIVEGWLGNLNGIYEELPNENYGTFLTTSILIIVYQFFPSLIIGFIIVLIIMALLWLIQKGYRKVFPKKIISDQSQPQLQPQPSPQPPYYRVEPRMQPYKQPYRY